MAGLIKLLSNVPDGSGKPVAIIAHTVKGKGVSFMEDDNNWHYRIPTADEVRGVEEGTRSRGMRNAFADEITKLGAVDPKIVLLSGDIGNKLFDKFKDGAAAAFLQLWRRRGEHDERRRRHGSVRPASRDLHHRAVHHDALFRADPGRCVLSRSACRHRRDRFRHVLR